MIDILPKDTKTLKTAADAINASERLILTCHVKPDADAVGSVLGLGLALKSAGKDVTFLIEDPVPDTIGFLPGSQYIVNKITDPLPEKTTLVILDCNELQRIGKQAQKLTEHTSLVVILDHHPSNGPFRAANSGTKHCHCISHILQDISATGAIVLWILMLLEYPISKDIATNLYATILADTGGFRHSNTDETALQMAGYLVAHGADPYAIANNLYQNYPLRRQRLLGLALGTLEVKGHGKIGILHVTPEMFRICGAEEHNTDDFVGHVRCINTVEVAIFIKEACAGQVSVSLRSKSSFNVAELARKFGGGGHFRAAGFRKAGTASEVREALLSILEPCFQNNHPPPMPFTERSMVIPDSEEANA